MRVLVLTRAELASANVRLLAHLGRGLAERGAAVGFLTRPQPAVRALFESIGEAAVPFEFRDTGAIAAWRAARTSIRSFTPDVVITDGERDALLAALTSGRGVGIVRRLRPARDAQWRWRSGLAARLRRYALLVPNSGEMPALPRHVHAVRTPVALPLTARAPLQVSSDESPAPLAIACLPDASGARAALCLRAVARLRHRRPELRLILLGEQRRMQAVRIHAAALGLTECIRTLPEAALFGERRLEVAAVWIATGGDDGALAAVAAMSRGLPVIVDHASDVAPLVAHRITGLHAYESELSTCIASVAQLLADPVSFHSTCDAALARVQRLHSWPAFLDRVVEAIELTRSDRPVTDRTRAAGATA